MLNMATGKTKVELSHLQDLKLDDENNISPSERKESGKMKELLKNQLLQFLKKKLNSEGVLATGKYIEEQLNRWKSETVKIAITGKSAVGKSTFINTVRGVGPDDDGFARAGSGDTTQEIQEYADPKNPLILYYDFPGAGTLKVTKEQFLRKTNLKTFDYFIICFKDVLSEDDGWLADQIRKHGKPFSLVRTMLDLDITNEKHNKPKDDRREEMDIIQDIRKKTRDSIKAVKDKEIMETLQVANVFVISSRDTRVGELNLLLEHIKNFLPEAKYEAFLHSLPVLTKEVIEKKYEELNQRIIYVTTGAGMISALPVPFLDIPLNLLIIRREVSHYLNAFGLDKDEVKEIPGIKHVVAMGSISQFVNAGIKAAAGVGALVLTELTGFIFPVVGSAVSGSATAACVYHFLKKTLNEFKEDAYTAHEHHLKQAYAAHKRHLEQANAVHKDHQEQDDKKLDKTLNLFGK